LISTPEGSGKDNEEDKSSIGFVDARVDHSYEAFGVTVEGNMLLLWDGANDQEAGGGVYMSRSEDDEDALIAILDPEERTKRRTVVSDSASTPTTSQLFALVCLRVLDAILSRAWA
jgi:hypothetical protein